MATRTISTMLFCALLVAWSPAALGADEGAEEQGIVVESSSMKAGEQIPADYTQFGTDVSPPISWKNLPEGTQELALICDLPNEKTGRSWVHWVVYNIPASVAGLPEGLPRDAKLEEPKALTTLTQGLSGWEKPGYRGPWPRGGEGPQLLRFRVYALDAVLNLKPGLNKDALLKAIGGHVIGEGELAVISGRQRRQRQS